MKRRRGKRKRKDSRRVAKSGGRHHETPPTDVPENGPAPPSGKAPDQLERRPPKPSSGALVQRIDLATYHRKNADTADEEAQGSPDDPQSQCHPVSSLPTRKRHRAIASTTAPGIPPRDGTANLPSPPSSKGVPREASTVRPDDSLLLRVLRITAVSLFLGGWLIAVVFAHGFDLHRLYWPSVLCGLGATLFLLASHRRIASLSGPVILLLLVGLAYFLIRAWTSPVWDLARLDFPLICGFGLALMLGSVSPGRRLIIAVLAIATLAHAGIGFYQQFANSAFSPFRGERTDQLGVSGLYYHRNYLAGYLGVFLPFLLCFLFGRPKPTGNQMVLLGRGLFVAAILLVLFSLLVMTFSRGGVVSAALGCFVSLMALLLSQWTKENRKNKGLLAATGVLGVILFASLLTILVPFLFEARGRGRDLASGHIGATRFDLSGMAYERWLERPLTGQGSRGYSYQSIADWNSPANAAGGSPDMVHNDYLQTLTDYGLIGLVLVLAFGAWIWFRSARQTASSATGRNSNSGWIHAALLGALAAAAFHATVDFSMHILPNLMLLGLLMGMAVAGDRRQMLPKTGNGIWKTVIMSAGAALLTWAWIGAGWSELRATPTLVRFERLAYSPHSSPDEFRQALHKALNEAPNYSLAQQAGAMELARATHPGLSDQDAETAAAEALRTLRIAVDRHPFDGEALVNYGSALELSGLPGAGDYYRRAVEATWRRESRYGAMFLYSLSLARQAETLLDQQRPAEALGCLEQSRDYLTESWRLRYRKPGKKAYDAQIAWLNSLIRSLESAEITPTFRENSPPPPSLAKH